MVPEHIMECMWYVLWLPRLGLQNEVLIARICIERHFTRSQEFVIVYDTCDRCQSNAMDVVQQVVDVW